MRRICFGEADFSHRFALIGTIIHLNKHEREITFPFTQSPVE
ncbi:MAG: hypothetical protein AAF629_01710 [Chloroflexota bacterium]